MKDQYRQGDVFIIKVDEKATGKKQERDAQKRLVLEYGEVTGHCHAIHDEEVDVYLEGARRFLEVCYQATLQHEEHAPIPLPHGTYEVRRQCTWSVLQQMATQVID